MRPWQAFQRLFDVPFAAYRLALALVILVSLTPGCASSSSLGWQPLNHGLRDHVPVLALAFDPVAPQVMYAGVYDAAGLYRSHDGGHTWVRADHGLEGQPVYALLPDPIRRGVVLAGAADGLYRTTDGGQSWQAVSALPWPMTVYALARDAAGILYLGGDQPEVFYSSDEGEAWKPLSPLPGGTAVLSLAVAPASELLLAGTDGQGLFLSRDSGRTWQAAEGVSQSFVAGLWFAPEDGLTAYARTRRGLFRTTDGGQIWRSADASVAGRIDALAFHPSTLRQAQGTAGSRNRPADGRLYLATGRGLLYRSDDGGDSWQPWGNGLGRSQPVFTLQFAPNSPPTLYAGTEAGLYRSDDGGRTWQPVTDGPGYPSATALHLASDGTLYLANVDGVYHSIDMGEHWEWRGTGLPTRGVLSLAVSPADGRLYAGTNGHGVYRSTDGGQTWMAAGLTELSVPALALHPLDPQRLYARVLLERVYESDDGGNTWGARWQGLGLSTEIISLAVDPHRPQTLYAGGTQVLFKSQDGALSWQGIGPELAGQTVFYLAVDSTNPEWVYAGATKGLYRSTDGGQSWSNWGTGLEDITVTALAFHPRQADLVYAGTKYRGVYRSGDGGRTWRPASGSLGQMSVNSLAVSPDGRWVLAATSRGFFRGVAQ